ncbi:FAM64A [Sigmodon hispidus]
MWRRFQRRLPLRAVNLNLGTGPSWKHLKTPEPEQQGHQAVTHSAKSSLSATSQRIQESCQSGTKWLMETQVRKDRGCSPPSLSQKNTRLCRARMGPHAHRHQRLRREAALWSPCSSTEPLSSPSESDSDLEPVGAGIQHLQKLPQKLDKAIKAEESGDMTVSLIRE